MSTHISLRQKLHSVNNYDFLSAQSRHYGYYPLIKGDKTPSFFLHISNAISKNIISGSLANEVYISIADLLEYQQPLTILFYNAGNSNQPNIKALESLQADVQVMGGKLLIITNTAPKYFKKALKHHDQLTIFYDTDNSIAEQFGIYDAQNPIWQWVSGVEQDDIPLPAAYIIAPNGQINYHFIDYNLQLQQAKNFSELPFVRDLLTTIYNVSQQYHYQPLQYKSVS
jgi:peroxiredoxin